MDTDFPDILRPGRTRLRRSIGLTRAGMIAEQVVQAFWPLMSVILAALAALMLGLQDSVPVEVVWEDMSEDLAIPRFKPAGA